MKRLVFMILPINVRDYLIRLKLIFRLIISYFEDMKRFKKYSISFGNNFSYENLRSKITFHYHSIEKGLSNTSFRYGFGERAFKELFFALDKYLELGYPKDDIRFQSALNIIDYYIKFHNENGYKLDSFENKAKRYLTYLNQKYLGITGVEIRRISQNPDFKVLNFKDIAYSRHSVRDFGEEKIDEVKVINAIKIASNSPSVCNRQSWKVRLIKNVNVINNVLSIHNGLKGYGNNISYLIVVSCDKQYMIDSFERNQTFIDGGIFTMSLLYALTYENIATCTLNANLNKECEIEIRKILKIELSEDLIAFIALGSYPNVYKYTKSPKDNYELFTIVI